MNSGPWTNSFSDRAADYAADVQVAYVRAGALGWAIAIGWFIFPFALATLLHPSDAIRLQYVLQGQPPPHWYTTQQLAAGFIEALFALFVLALLALVGMVLFFRRAQLNLAPVASPPLWPLAALAGVFGDAFWFVGTQQFDIGGALIGFGSAALTVGGEMLCERLGRDFVMGRALSGQHP